MSTAWQFYISTLLVYLGVDVMAVWGLNLQFGVAGVINFALSCFRPRAHTPSPCSLSDG